MVSERRAEAALRELGALEHAGLDLPSVHAEALGVLASVVPFDGACIGAVDPDTMLLTSGVTLGFEPTVEETARFFEIEVGGLDRNSFTSLVERDIAVLADDGDVAPARRTDVRFNELSRLVGFRHETRLTFAVDGACWAVGDLYRESARHSFDTRELAFLERAADRVAVATRRAVNVPSIVADRGPAGAAVLVLDARGRAVGITEMARRWIDELDPATRGRLEHAVLACSALARRGAPHASTRLRVGRTWTVVHASRMQTDGDLAQVAVTIEQASAERVNDLLVAAHGLSPRERDVCREVLAGRSTQEIATELFIAAHTVQDHLKSIFVKVGVRSRRELVATLG